MFNSKQDQRYEICKMLMYRAQDGSRTTTAESPLKFMTGRDGCNGGN